MTSTLNIMLVEDDPGIVSFVERGLTAEGHTLTALAEGREAVRKAVADRHDIILLDLLLPDLHGCEACRQIRKLRVMTPILMLTALDGTDDIVEGLEAGADDYLTKPFDFEELLARICSLRRRVTAYRSDPSQRLWVGDLGLDHESRKVYIRDRELDLTVTEYHLLSVLMRHAGQALSRTEILESVWHTDKDPLTNIVDVYIRHLRRKITTANETVTIQTIRGYGYRLAPPDIF
ncbi:MAG: response regulator transcription factor [Geminicoccaceae bacterium]